MSTLESSFEKDAADNAETAAAYREIGYGGWGKSHSCKGSDGSCSIYKSRPHTPPVELTPEMEAQNKAKFQLQYESSEFVSSRFFAGITLGADPSSMGKMLDEGLGRLRIQLNAQQDSGRTKRVEVGSHEETIEYKIPSCDRHAGPATESITVTDYEDRRIMIPDKTARLDALKDLGGLRELDEFIGVNAHPQVSALGTSSRVNDLLKETYDSNSLPEIREEAGRMLGGGELRIAMHVHPGKTIAKIVTGVAAAALATSGVAYALVEYLSQ